MSDFSQSAASPAPILEPTASPVTRGAAFLGGLCILLVATVFSLGSALVAPLGMIIVTKIQHSRGRVLSVLGHWVAAVASVMVLFALLGTVGASVVPKAAFDKFRRQSDSLSAKQPPPAWIERMAPGTTKRIAESKRKESATVQTLGMAFGAAFVVIFFGLVFGSLGWVGGALIGLGVKGHWPGSGASSTLA
jgi:hypothetical protein